MQYFLFLLVLFVGSFCIQAHPCALRKSSYGFVCVCNSTYCDDLEVSLPPGSDDYVVVSTSKDGLMFAETHGKFKPKAPSVVVPKRSKRFFESWFGSNSPREAGITVNREEEFQKVYGFGGAFTTAVSHNLDKLSEGLKNYLYKSYFAKDTGIGYNFLRISIGGCDFDLEPWAYNEYPENDVHLTNFTGLDPRDDEKIRKIKRLMEISNNYDVKLMGAAWSPPVWMKSNKKWTGSSYLLEEYYPTWADYHIRYMELMASRNLSLWAISTGNEPGNGNIGALFVYFMSLGWTATDQAVWVAEHLGPKLRNSEFKNVKLFSPDDQRYNIPSWLEKMDESRPGSTNYLDGIAFHWYWDDIFSVSLLDKAHDAYNGKLLFNTESCVGDKPWETHGPELGSWSRAEKYIRSYIQDFQHWVNAWIDWNLILDEQGGPNYVNNYVDAPIIANTTSGDEFYKQPMFYGIGHFSKFVPQDSVRIGSQSTDSYVEVVAFKRPDTRIALIVLNKRDTVVTLTIADSLRGDIVVEIPRNSVHTFVYN